MSPVDFIARPLRWLSLISNRRIQASGGPNFAYDLCVRRITPKQKASLDLSCWDLAFTGAEPIRSNTLRRFAEEFAQCGFRMEAFYPCYGMAEATLLITGSQRGQPPSVRLLDRGRIGQGEVAETHSLSSIELVGAGHAGAGIQVRIVDPQTQEICAPDRAGEIWVAGSSVGQGYWGREHETAQTFGARLRGQEDGAEFLRTGDLGFLRDGELFVVGRIKDLVIVNGVNYYPQDIEAIADQAHESIRLGATAAVSLDGPSGEVLAIVAESNTDHRPELEAAATAIRSKITGAIGIAPEVIALIARHTLPKTPSGKVCRNEARQGLLDGKLRPLSVFDWREAKPITASEIEDQDPAEQQRMALARLGVEQRKQVLTALVIEAIDAVKPVGAVSTKLDTPVAELGLDSIHVVELLAELEERSGAILPMEQLARGATITELVQAISKELDNQAI
jgi:acyl-CoA synthetase (AMP-forming)/AMP-acid ligase II/acyl carrier protein